MPIIMTIDALRYPVGPFAPETATSARRRVELINELADYPRSMREVLDSVGVARIDTPYRPGGWSVRQTCTM